MVGLVLTMFERKFLSFNFRGVVCPYPHHKHYCFPKNPIEHVGTPETKAESHGNFFHVESHGALGRAMLPLFYDILMDEVRKAINKLHKNKASGADGQAD